MSPPIREGSGDSIGSIRLGDGSEISEVRTGAGDVLFSAIPDSVVSRPSDGSSSTGRNDVQGMEIELKSDWPSIGARISNNSSGASTARLYDSSTRNQVDSVDISGLSSGDAFTFDDVSLNSGERYIIFLDGSNWTLGFASSTNYPFTSNDVDITGNVSGSTGSSVDQTSVQAINDIGNTGF